MKVRPSVKPICKDCHLVLRRSGAGKVVRRKFPLEPGRLGIRILQQKKQKEGEDPHRPVSVLATGCEGNSRMIHC